MTVKKRGDRHGTAAADASALLDFWLEAGPKRWFAKDDAFDVAIGERFEDLHHAAARGELAPWADSAATAAALILLTDQIPRNLWRGSAHAFATDPMALAVARASISRRFDRAVAARLRSFCYMPFIHSEAMADQDTGVALFEAMAAETGESAAWSHHHRDIIVRFGRFPHRNSALGRTSTPEEQAFLDAGGFAG